MNRLSSNGLWCIAALFMLAGCEDGAEEPTESGPTTLPSAETPPQAGSAPAFAGLGLTPPAGWVAEPPASSVRFAQYRLPGDGSSDDAQLVIYYFGPTGAGPVEGNINRWCRQFEQPDGRDSRGAAVTAERTVNGLALTTIDLSGTYVAETSPGSGERVNKPDYRLLGAIIETDAGPYYVKLVGPAQTVARWQASYDAFILSLRPQVAETDAASTPHP
ncbi:MAG: hypothetical protein ACYSTY_09885 [Planctomycetota bacterium]